MHPFIGIDDLLDAELLLNLVVTIASRSHGSNDELIPKSLQLILIAGSDKLKDACGRLTHASSIVFVNFRKETEYG
jgi:hypothetical protein